MKIKLGQTVKVVECGCNHKGVHNGLMGKVANFWDNGDVDVSLPKDVCFARKVTTLKPKPMKRKEVCDHCGGDLAIRNPKGYCDHLHYPENCKDIENKINELVDEINKLKLSH